MKRGSTPIDQVRHFDETTSAWVTLNHIQYNGTCGSVIMTEYDIPNTNNTLTKRKYSMHPLCTGHYGIDYCANHNKWGGIYASGELSNQINQIVQNDETAADYYKLYTVEQDGVSEDWQL